MSSSRILGRLRPRLTKRLFSSEPTPAVESKPVDKLHGSYHWTYERALSVASLGLVSGAFAFYPNKLVDFALGLVLPLHSHLGFSAIITDYLPKRKFPVVYPVAMGALYGMTAITMYGLYALNTEGPGLCEFVANVWTAKRSKESAESD